MLKGTLAAAALMAVAAPAVAQTAAEPAESEGTEGDLELSIGPQYSSNRPFSAGEVTDVTEAALTVTVSQPLLSWLDGEVTLGPTLTFDDEDEDDGSGFGAGAELSTQKWYGLSAFAAYGHEWTFTEVFEEDDGAEGTLSAGLRLEKQLTNRCLPADTDKCTGDGLVLKLSPYYVNVDASADEDDFEGYVGKAGLSSPFFFFADLDLEASVQRREYDQPDAATGQQRDQWRYNVFAGLNFAPGIERIIRDKRFKEILREVKLGVSYSETDSTIASENESERKLAPSLVIGTSF